MTKSHGNHGKVVHRLYSSYISSVENLTGIPLSFSCQLGLGCKGTSRVMLSKF